MKKLIELGKSLLIAVLICTLLLLTFAAMPVDMIRGNPTLSTVLQPFAPLLGLPQAELAYVEDARPVSDAAQPLSISVLNSAGRYTARWDFAALDSAYETLGGILGEALDTAESFAAVRPDRMEQVLSCPGVCFDYGFSLSARLLASWLDAAPVDSVPEGSMYVLALEEERVVLYLYGTGCYRAETQVDPQTFTALLDTFKEDGSHYAFETDSHLSRLTLIPGSDPVITAATSANPCDTRYIENLATELGFNPYDDSSYTDSSGSTWFSETNCSLQVSANGEILLTSTSGERFLAAGEGTESLVEEARALVELAVGDVIGDARIYLSGVTRSGDETVCTFDYVLNGIPVQCGEAAASVTFRGRALTEFRMLAAQFAQSAEVMKILPHTQVAAILPKGGKLTLEYDRTTTGPLAAGWK